jgi:hypothetical protein
MAKQSRSPTPAPTPAHAVTADRAKRLCRLLRLLGPGGQTRAALLRRLRLDVRGFYRDLKLLRDVGVLVELHDNRYVLQGSADAAVSKVPFPDPGLTVGEAVQLSKGRTNAHRKLKGMLDDILP